MNYKVIREPYVVRQIKNYKKKYKSFENDIIELEKTLSENPKKGILLKTIIYKIRFAVKSKGFGKSGGFRCIYVILEESETVHLAYLYNKSEMKNIPKKLLNEIAKEFIL